MFVRNFQGAAMRQGVMEPIGLEPTTSCMPCNPARVAPQRLTTRAHQMRTTRDASVEAVFRHHNDLTTAEAAEVAGVHKLHAAQSIRRLYDARRIEPREPRRCRVLARVMRAWVVAPCD